MPPPELNSQLVAHHKSSRSRKGTLFKCRARQTDGISRHEGVRAFHPEAEVRRSSAALVLEHFVSLRLLFARAVIILVKAGAPVDETIAGLLEHMEAGDIIIDGGNEWWAESHQPRLEPLPPPLPCWI